MIYVTGDTHKQFSRFSNKLFHAGKDDIVIVCGDFGLISDGSKTQQYWTKWLSEKPYTILFCCGNHENFDLLYQYHIVHYAGGLVHRISDNIYHLMRGEVFTLEGKKFFVMGGAQSHDIEDGILDPADRNYKHRERVLKKQGKELYRTKGIDWWEQEMPSEREYAHAKETLHCNDYVFDYIITHDCPTSIRKQLNVSEPTNELNEFLQFTADHCTFRTWFFGHYHEDKIISEQYRMLHQDIIALP